MSKSLFFKGSLELSAEEFDRGEDPLAGGGGEFVAEFDEPAAGEEVGGFDLVGIVIGVVFSAGADVGCDVDGPKG